MQQEIVKVVAKVHDYWQARLDGQDVAVLSEIIRELRILLQAVLTDSFLSLPLPRAKEFRFALQDHLSNACNTLGSRCSKTDMDHHFYCMQEVLTCFEWAEQIKSEIPDDLLTQRVLAVDIPILRPFHYGLAKTKPIKRPR